MISDVDLNELLKFHKKNKCVLTIGVKHFQYKNPYGVIVSEKNRFISFEEKPEVNFTINTGIYIFNKKIIPIINKFNLKNIEDLIVSLINKNYKIFTYPIFENWYDLGQDKKLLTNLLNGSNKKVIYNNVDYQQKKGDVSTCGRHCIFRILNLIKYKRNLPNYYNKMKDIKKQTKLNFDEIVTAYINKI